LSDAVDDLLGRATQDPGRLNMLADYCKDAFARAGLPGVRGGQADEVGIRGLARNKDWDLAYVLAGKPRLLVSLKSILSNIRGTVPNRLDDLMGEAANVQQLSPEIVVGYVVIVDEAGNAPHTKTGATWIDYFEERLRAISIRRAPIWNQGLIEGLWLIRIDSRLPRGQRVLETEAIETRGTDFFRSLLAELHLREPTLRPPTPPAAG